MSKVKLYIAGSNFVFGEGLRAIFKDHPEIDLLGVAHTSEQLKEAILTKSPEVLLIDYTSEGFHASNVTQSLRLAPGIKVVGVTHDCEVDLIRKLLESGIYGHLLSDCDRDEIVDSVICTHKGDKFFCGKVLDQLNADFGDETKHGCESVTISERELEILQLVAQGLTTKQIADHLFLSFHTVMTHRKNMMGKLGINNTAGLIIYAVRENLISPNKFLFSEQPK